MDQETCTKSGQVRKTKWTEQTSRFGVTTTSQFWMNSLILFNCTTYFYNVIALVQYSFDFYLYCYAFSKFCYRPKESKNCVVVPHFTIFTLVAKGTLYALYTNRRAFNCLIRNQGTQCKHWENCEIRRNQTVVKTL